MKLIELAGRASRLWCAWTHGGGHIVRDNLGRVNWQCAKCGRWADAVPADVENALVAAALRARAAMEGE